MRYLSALLVAATLAFTMPAHAAPPPVSEVTALAVAQVPAAPVQMPAETITAPVPQPDDLAAFAQTVIDAFKTHNWGLLAALGLILLVWLARKYGAKAWPFLATDRGGALLSLVLGLGMSIAAAAMAPGGGTVGSVIMAGLLMSITASGTFALLKKLLFPSGAALAQEAAVGGAAAGAKLQAVGSGSPEAAADALNRVGK